MNSLFEYEAATAEMGIVRLCDLPPDEDISGRPDSRMVAAFRRALDGGAGVEVVVRISRSADGFAIRDGGRTIKALRAAGFPDDFGVPCFISDAHDGDTGFNIDRIAFNSVRSPNPADAYVAVVNLIGAGWDAKRIAAESGMPLQKVREIVAIAATLAPLVVAWLEGRVAYSTIKALSRMSTHEQRTAVDAMNESDGKRLTMDDIKTIRYRAAQSAGQNFLFDDAEIATGDPVDYGYAISGVVQDGVARITLNGKRYVVKEEDMVEWLASK